KANNNDTIDPVVESDHTGVEPKADIALAEESHPLSPTVSSSQVAVIVTQVSNELIEDEEPPQGAEDDVLIVFGGGDKPDASDVDSTDMRAIGTGGGSVLVQIGSELAEDSTEIKNYLVQNNDHIQGMEPSEPPIESTLNDGSTRTATNTIVDQSDDGTVRTTIITTTTTLNTTGDDIPEDLEEQLLKQLRDQQLLQEQQQLQMNPPQPNEPESNQQVITITTTTAEEDPDTGLETTSTSTTRTTTTTKTITLTPDGDFPEDELLQKITTTTTHSSQQNVPEMVKETTVTVTEMVDGRTLDGAAKALNNIVDDFMNHERKN
uniref:Uncharacterized protein n=1 Tax=Anopheles christyi TaxID=43041 RepID=A0A182JUZ5_9DIPT